MDNFDLVVIGAGPGGYVAAIRAAQLGMKVACVEKEPLLGGTCLRVGCIPSKALLESSEKYHEAKTGLSIHGVKVKEVSLDLDAMMSRKRKVMTTLSKGVQSLLKKGKIARFEGTGEIVGSGRVMVHRVGESIEVGADRILIATGSRVAPLRGVELDGDRIGTSAEALSYSSVPQHLVVIGAGYIGLELGSVWCRLGARVTVLEYMDRILPGMDPEMADEALKIFRKQGLDFRLGSRVTEARARDDGCIVVCEGQDPIQADRVLLAVGRIPNTEGLGLASVGVTPDGRGRIPVNERFETSAAGIHAIGDVIEGPMLAHKAEEEGVACVEWMSTGYGHVSYDTIPGVCYTHPEIASVGRTEDDLEADGVSYRKGVFPFRGNGRARALDAMDGWVKVLAHAETDRVLGVHIIGPRAGDLIAEAVVAMELHASSEDIARAIHAHPTLSETLKEAALAVDGRALHG